MKYALLSTVLVTAVASASAKTWVSNIEAIQPDSMVIVVRTTSGEPIYGARVDLETPHLEERRKVSAHSDYLGRTVLPFPPDSGWVRVRSFGFITGNLRVHADATNPLLVNLKQDATLLTQVCTTSLNPAITLLPDTTVPPDTTAVTIRVVDGTYEEERVVRLHDLRQRFHFAYERAGTYDVTASAAGFEDWRRTDIRVVKRECHVSHHILRIRLVRR